MLGHGSPLIADPAVDAAAAREDPQDVLEAVVLPQARINYLEQGTPGLTHMQMRITQPAGVLILDFLHRIANRAV
jgi:hypothetical protein